MIQPHPCHCDTVPDDLVHLLAQMDESIVAWRQYRRYLHRAAPEGSAEEAARHRIDALFTAMTHQVARLRAIFDLRPDTIVVNPRFPVVRSPKEDSDVR